MNITANISTWSDADFAQAFRIQTGTGPDTFYDFTGAELHMMIRKLPDDVEVFISLTSALPDGAGGIMFNDPETNGHIEVFNITMMRDQFVSMQPGDYVQSLIMLRPDGIYEDIWHGALTHAIGPTR